MAKPGERGGAWLREGRQQNASHAVEKAPQFRSSMERFAERCAERLSATFAALFSVAMEEMRSAKTFAALEAHHGQPAVALRSDALNARMAFLFEVGSVNLLIATMFGFETANDFGAAEPPKAPTALEMRMLGEIAVALAEALRQAFAPVADFDLGVEGAETVEDNSLLGAKDMPTLLAPVSIRSPAGGFTVTLMLPHPFLGALASALARGPAPGWAELSGLVEPHGEARHRGEPDADRRARRIPDEPRRRLDPARRPCVAAERRRAGAGAHRLRSTSAVPPLWVAA